MTVLGKEIDVAQAAILGVTFISICVLVGLGKVKPELLELVLAYVFGVFRPSPLSMETK